MIFNYDLSYHSIILDHVYGLWEMRGNDIKEELQGSIREDVGNTMATNKPSRSSRVRASSSRNRA